MIIPVNLGVDSYNIYLERGGIAKAEEYFNLNRKVLVVTDTGVPGDYARCVMNQCAEPTLVVIEQGEASKSLDSWSHLLKVMTEKGFTRTDCVVAVGGGVVGDLSGFAAAAYMRGIDFYNIPTTLLSQVDSSIGGKVAIDFHGYKNIVGAFHQPKAVIVDPETLSTLPKRQVTNGIIEALKMSMTFDAEIFALFQNGEAKSNLDKIIEGSLRMKKAVVEADEKEAGLRKVLNFGHTIGHAIESNSPELYHGECVGLGMLALCRGEIKEQLLKILKELEAPTKHNCTTDELLQALLHDKKKSGDKISVVLVEKIGEFGLRNFTIAELKEFIGEVN